ncbi:Ribosomal protein var1, mitochondrial [Frankliniella fusca]|uniref:Ribosomal protein var1, mitochondrial n=1 Tax=Frankliniella fusca TaxID=407009 RepID=A0AAE1H770_9NEOP|nr:Ribosomal protein var1, mitochondrial [Frankliniella fusca]
MISIYSKLLEINLQLRKIITTILINFKKNSEANFALQLKGWRENMENFCGSKPPEGGCGSRQAQLQPPARRTGQIQLEPVALFSHRGVVAQLVERATPNRVVRSSTPTRESVFRD